MSSETHYLILKALEQNPAITQRQLASELGISLGKVNYCLKALINKGWVKAENFKNSNKKIAYFYVMTPMGLSQKVKITLNFLKHKETEFESLKEEIETLRKEVDLDGMQP